MSTISVLGDDLQEADNDQPQAEDDEPEFIDVSFDGWLETLAWIEKEEVGLKFALINAYFDRMVDMHFNHRNWKLGEMFLHRPLGSLCTEVSFMNDGVHGRTLPLATTPMPRGVNGFKSLCIRYVDRKVIAFLKAMQRLFRKKISMQFSIHYKELRAWSVMSQMIWPLFAAGITTLHSMMQTDHARLCRHISPNVLRNSCINLRHISSLMYPCNRIDDSPEQHLHNWLHEPRADGLPKILTFKYHTEGYRSLLQNCTTAFKSASTPVNYMIYTVRSGSATMPQIDQHNFKTDERLVTRRRPGGGWYACRRSMLLTRSPERLNPDQLAEWERNTTAQDAQEGSVNICFEDCDIEKSLLAELYK